MSRFDSLDIEPSVAEAFRRGDRGAAERVYGVLSKAVYGLTLRLLGDAEAAAEVTQDTFLDAIEKASTLREGAALAGWVRSIAVNHCLMRLRSPWHRRLIRPAGGVMKPDVEMPDGSLDSTRLNGWRDLAHALGTLSNETRFVVWMHHVEGYTHAELGKLLGRSASYSKSQLSRGLKRLQRQVLQDNEARANGAGANVEGSEVHE
jgi:RNA polymerase sigma factor (sigma-70 family)